MFKIYQKYIISNFILKFLNISIIFFCLTIILGLLEEISFFKNLNKNILYPYFLTFLNAPITLFEIFPFIFLLTTQFLFYDLFKKEELNLLKKNGLNNLKIIKPDITHIALGDKNNPLFFYRDPNKTSDSIKKHSERDAKNWWWSPIICLFRRNYGCKRNFNWTTTP